MYLPRRCPAPLGRAAALLLAVLLCSLYPPARAAGDEVDAYALRQIHRHHIPGLSLAIVRDGRVVKAAGYGLANVELGARATPRTVYGLASMSKQFAAAAILLLVQDGKVSLGAPVSAYLRGTPAAWNAITVRHLLTHTSGLPREGIQTTDKTGRADFTRDELWTAAQGVALQAAPGERFAYSNLGYNLLALIVERVSGKAYGDFLQARIFGPLGMHSTRVNDLYVPIPHRAAGYSWVQGHLRIAEPTSPTLYFGAGAIASTVIDLAKWDAALYSDRILTADSRRQMTLGALLNSGRPADYGFGWFVDSLQGHARTFHDGQLAGFRTYIARFPADRLTLIVLTNLGTLGNPGSIADGIARHYLPGLADYLDAPVESRVGNPQARSPGANGAAALAELTGRYEYAENRMLTVGVAKGRLVAHLPDSESDIYTRLSDSVFVCREESTRLTFQRKPNGEVNGIDVQVIDGRRMIPRIGPLPRTLTATADPNLARSGAILAVLKAIAQGGKAVNEVKGITAGARADFAGSEPDLAGVDSTTYLGERDVSGLVRHGAAVARVIFYQWKASAAARYIQVYLTADGLVADEDVVDE